MDLGKRLKAKRKEKNISAEYLAKELGDFSVNRLQI